MPAEIWLTQDAYDRLKAELDHLTGPGRQEITARIEQARSEGDLKENGGYHAAREEQGKAEGRIRQLTELLDELRYERAQQLLEQTRMPIEDIAATLQFSKPGAFSRAYKAWTGVTPRSSRTMAARQ